MSQLWRHGKRLSSAAEPVKSGRAADNPNELPRVGGHRSTAENTAPPQPQFAVTVIAGWLALGIASVALAPIAGLILHSERETDVIVHQMNLIAIDLQD